MSVVWDALNRSQSEHFYTQEKLQMLETQVRDLGLPLKNGVMELLPEECDAIKSVIAEILARKEIATSKSIGQ